MSQFLSRRIMDQHLWYRERDEQAWIARGNHPSIADVACFPYTVLMEDAGLSRREFPAIRRWHDRFKRIEGFKVMSGVFPAR